METFSPNFSLRGLEQLIAADPISRNMVWRLSASSYAEFVNVLYKDLDLVISELELNPQHYQNDCEDKLTAFIISMLKMKGYDASHGTTGGGSKDITVNGSAPSWSWIGEAKIYNSITDLREGFLQLSTRYRNVDPLKSCGGLLAYTRREYAADLMDKWKKAVGKIPLRNFRVCPCPSRDRLGFISVHDHISSGLPFEVRHLAICLYHRPLDKSGRTAKKYQDKS